MKNKNILKKITQGMYVLTTQNQKENESNNSGGCIVDALAQISAGDHPLIAVSVMKKNYTNQLLKQNQRFALSILSTNVNPEIIKTFGFNTAKEIDKFAPFDTVEIENVKIIKDSLGYFVCEKIEAIDNDTHTLFIGKIIEADMFKDDEPMSYTYYQNHKEELLKITTEKGKTFWVCTICGYIYEGETIPDDFTCPTCGVKKDLFKKQ